MLTAWERVYRLLRDAFPPEHYHRGRGFAKFTQDADMVRAHFSDGETVEADLLVGADGIRSTVRQQCLPDVTPRYAGYSRLARADRGIAISRRMFITNCSNT